MRRIAGWVLVPSGVGYALAWLLLPLAYANDAALLVLLLGLTYAAVFASFGSMIVRSRLFTAFAPLAEAPTVT